MNNKEQIAVVSRSESFYGALRNMQTFLHWNNGEHLIPLRFRLWLTILLNCVLMNVFTVGIVLMKQDESLSTPFCRVVVGLHSTACVLQILSLYQLWNKQVDLDITRAIIFKNAAILGVCFLIATPVVDYELEEQSQYGCLAMILTLLANLFNVISCDRRALWFANAWYLILIIFHTRDNGWPMIKTVTAPLFVILFTFIGDFLNNNNKKHKEKLSQISKAAIIVTFMVTMQYISHWLWEIQGVKNIILLIVTQVLCNRALFKNIEGIAFYLLSIALLCYQFHVILDEEVFNLVEPWQQYWFSLPIVSNIFQMLLKLPKNFKTIVNVDV